MVVADDVYDLDCEQRLAFYTAATREAIAEGHTGLAVVAEVTTAGQPGRRWGEHLRWELRADRLIASGSGMTALCGYHAPELAPDRVADAAAVHPLFWQDVPSGFRVFVESGRLVLQGEIDHFDCGRLARLLEASPHGTPDAVLDLSRLTFIDSGGAMVIGHWASTRCRAGERPRVVGASATFLKVWDILGWPARLGREVTAPC